MKSHHSARWLKNVGVVTGCVAILALAGIEVKAGKSWGRQIDRLAARQIVQPPACFPNATVGDFLAIAIR